MSYFQVIAGQVIGSDHMNTAIDQGVIPFVDVASRDAALPAPNDGMLCYLTSTKQHQRYIAGLGWQPLVPVATIQSAPAQSGTNSSGSWVTMRTLTVAADPVVRLADVISSASLDGTHTEPWEFAILVDGTLSGSMQRCWPGSPGTPGTRFIIPANTPRVVTLSCRRYSGTGSYTWNADNNYWSLIVTTRRNA